MSDIIDEVEIKTQDLGWCTARHQTDSLVPEQAFLLIFSPSSITEMTASPASDVRISGMKNIIKLRDFLNKLYPEKLNKEAGTNGNA